MFMKNLTNERSKSVSNNSQKNTLMDECPLHDNSDVIVHQLLFYRDKKQDGTGDVSNPSVIGSGGWDTFKFLFSSGNGIIYAVNQSGGLLFYRDKKQDGTGDVSNPSVIGSGGWDTFKFLFSGGNGIIYAVNQSGELLFYRDKKQDGTGDVSNPSVIGSGGWDTFKFLFSGGNGIIYAVNQSGGLLFYRDKKQDGTGDVSNPSVIGSGGWDTFKFLFSGGNGIIYAVNQSGGLLFYRDKKQDGTGDVSNPSVIGSGGWDTFKFLFSGGNGIIYAVNSILTVKYFKGVYYSTMEDDNRSRLCPIVIKSSGDIYFKESKIVCQTAIDSTTMTIMFDSQTINQENTNLKGEIKFFKNLDARLAFSGWIQDSSRIKIEGLEGQKTQVWAAPATTPLGSPGDHTWITMADSNCWRVLGGRDGYYCENSRWHSVDDPHVYFPPEGRLLKSTISGEPDKMNCMGGAEKSFLGIPRYAGVVYGLNGVCHQMANRLLLSADKLTVSGAVGYTLSHAQFGTYGTRGSIECISLYWAPIAPIIIPFLVSFIAGVNAEFYKRCSGCKVSYPGPTLTDQTPNEVRDSMPHMSVNDIYSSLLENHHQHLKELRQLFANKAGRLVSEQKINTIISLYDKMQLPSESFVKEVFDRSSRSLKSSHDIPELDVGQRLLLAEKFNEMVNSQQKAVANHLTQSEYISLFDFDPDQEVVLVDPKIMTITIK